MKWSYVEQSRQPLISLVISRRAGGAIFLLFLSQYLVLITSAVALIIVFVTGALCGVLSLGLLSVFLYILISHPITGCRVWAGKPIC